MKVKKIYVKPLMTEAEEEAMIGTKVVREHCKQLITYDADVYDKESGACLLKFRRGVIPANVQRLGYDNLLRAAIATDARGAATGIKTADGNLMERKVLKNGKLAKKMWVPGGKTVNSGVAGYYDRTVRFPNCRLTSFTRHHFDKFKAAYPIIKMVDNFYKQLMPEQYAKQRKAADSTPAEWIIPDTSFSTITINKNYSTAAHRDAGDFKEGFGNLVALRQGGKFEGCYFTMLRWGIGVDMQNGDLLMCDVHRVHGNTPMVVIDKGATRLSLVMYYRQNMSKCLPFAEELKRAQKRKRGEKL